MTMNRKRIYEIDLRQAESRFIAWDGPLPKMQQMYRENKDIHRFVASNIYGKPEAEVTDKERQLGKKSGHGANYRMKEHTFARTCLIEMDLVISPYEAKRILDGYFKSWDGDLERWQNRQIQFVKTHRYLDTPFGNRRQFFDRMSPNLENEICAYRPQSTIPHIINFLVKKLYYERPAASLKLLAQVHDSVKFEVNESEECKVISAAKDQDSWNPTLSLRGGNLRIPIEIKRGFNMYEMEEVFVG